MPHLHLRGLAALLILATTTVVAAPLPATLQPEDWLQLQQIGDPQVSPDGQWVVYTLGTADTVADRRSTDLWLVRWDGSQGRQLTRTAASESAPRWRGDSQTVTFLLKQPDDKGGPQLWQLDVASGRTQPLSRLPGVISGYEWSADGTRAVVTYQPAASAQENASKPQPLVIDRYEFKRDGQGYLTGTDRPRLHLFDPKQADHAEPLTDTPQVEESLPQWSPDGRQIAYVSNHDARAERTRNSDVFVVTASAGSTPVRLTEHAHIDGGFLAWSPDGRQLAYGQGSEQRLEFHNQYRLAVATVGKDKGRVLAPALDRSVSQAQFTADGRALEFLVADDRSQYLARADLASSTVTPVLRGARTILQQHQRQGHTVLLSSDDTTPPELYALERGQLRALTRHNHRWGRQAAWVPAQDVQFSSADGTVVHGLLTLPQTPASSPRPTVVWLHGGPNAQDSHAFQFERQLFAAHGYAVLSINYRGSSGRGAAYTESIFADWGQKEVQDVLAGVDYLVAHGIADPQRLGVGGWSYGGLLTDYVIASDTRFAAAISGAGSANHLSLYGHDQYVYLYDSQFGPPWENTALWLKFSYPFFHADRIKTPTLFLGGDRDTNVPILGSEQMYQALRYLDVPTRLVVYPGENHRFVRPSFEVDRLRRYVAWFDQYLHR